MKDMSKQQVEKFIAYLDGNIDRLGKERDSIRHTGGSSENAYNCKMEIYFYEDVKVNFLKLLNEQS